MALGFFRVPPLLFPRSWVEESVKVSGVFEHQQKVKGIASGGSYGWKGNVLLMTELRIKITRFREILDLSPCKASTPMNELLMGTVADLQKLYPNFVSCPPMSEMISASTYQVLCYFYVALESVGDAWIETHNWCNEFNDEKDVIENISLEQLGEMVIERLDYMDAVAKEIFDVMDEKDEENAPTVENSPVSTSEDFFKNFDFVSKLSICESPHTPTSVLPDAIPCSLNIEKVPGVSYSPPLLLPLRLKAMGKLKPTDVKSFTFHVLPHASIRNFSPVNQTTKTLEPDNCVTSNDSKAQPMDVENFMIQLDERPKVLNHASYDVTSEKIDDNGNVSSSSMQPPNPSQPMDVENSMIQLDERPKVLNHASYDVTSEKIDDNGNVSSSSMQPPNPSQPLMPLAKEFVLPPLPQPQPVLQPIQSAPPAAPLPMLPSNQSSSPFPLPSAKQSTFSPSPQMPPPPLLLSGETGFLALPSSPMAPVKGLAPPPPPLDANKALRPKKANTKLKRSTQMGSLYRLLKGKVEGSNLSGHLSPRRKVAGSADNKAQGMADALAEITKRSAYFRKIEEDVQKHATSIMEMKSAINSFRTNDMAELRKFHQYVELLLENLTDETQVLARFNDFPTKKLETLRTAAAMLSRLDGIATNLESWKIESPIAQQLKKVECYFDKIKADVDAIECKKDEEARRFQSHNIEFDFDVLLRIKEFMVDVSSNCIEMVLKESNETKVDADTVGGTKLNARLKACSESLWKAFQLAYRVYNFAGGQDDRADRLTKELAREIETYTNHY